MAHLRVSIMMSAAKRHWLQYSLRSLIVVVTAAAIATWYFRPSAFPFLVVGDLSSSDVSAICTAVAAEPGMEHPIEKIEVISTECVKVTVRLGDGPNDGGEMLTLRKENGGWTVETVTWWVY